MFFSRVIQTTVLNNNPTGFVTGRWDCFCIDMGRGGNKTCLIRLHWDCEDSSALHTFCVSCVLGLRDRGNKATMKTNTCRSVSEPIKLTAANQRQMKYLCWAGDDEPSVSPCLEGEGEWLCRPYCRSHSSLSFSRRSRSLNTHTASGWDGCNTQTPISPPWHTRSLTSYGSCVPWLAALLLAPVK